MKTVLITGISGFAGAYLAEFLLSQNKFTVFGTYLSDESLSPLATIKNQAQLEKLNLLDENYVNAFIGKVKPDMIFHLAAITSVSNSFKNPTETLTNNIAAQINVFEALRKQRLIKTKVLVTSSAEVYGIVDPKELPITEFAALRPHTPYAVSKIAQDFLALQYHLSYGFHTIRVRAFNHIGPRQSPQFVVSAFAKKIAQIEKRIIPPVLTVGNLDAKRDFTDVRDMVKAYYLLMQNGRAGEEYNVGSGTSHAISEILNKLLAFSKTAIEVQADPALLRPSDTPDLVCDNTKCRQVTGWAPRFSLDETLKETLDYWRDIV